MAVAKKNISLPENLFTDALARSKRMGYDSFSAYIQYLIAEDLRKRPQHKLIREEPEETGYGKGSQT